MLAAGLSGKLTPLPRKRDRKGCVRAKEAYERPPANPLGSKLSVVMTSQQRLSHPVYNTIYRLLILIEVFSRLAKYKYLAFLGRTRGKVDSEKRDARGPRRTPRINHVLNETESRRRIEIRSGGRLMTDNSLTVRSEEILAHRN